MPAEWQQARQHAAQQWLQDTQLAQCKARALASQRADQDAQQAVQTFCQHMATDIMRNVAAQQALQASQQSQQHQAALLATEQQHAEALAARLGAVQLQQSALQSCDAVVLAFGGASASAICSAAASALRQAGLKVSVQHAFGPASLVFCCLSACAPCRRACSVFAAVDWP